MAGLFCGPVAGFEAGPATATIGSNTSILVKNDSKVGIAMRADANWAS